MQQSKAAVALLFDALLNVKVDFVQTTWPLLGVYMCVKEGEGGRRDGDFLS